MNMPNKILVRSLELIESGWTQGTYARDAVGIPVPSVSPEACSWCSAGAQFKAIWELSPGPGEATKAEVALLVAMGVYDTAYNDTHTKAEVVAAFKAAIEATK